MNQKFKLAKHEAARLGQRGKIITLGHIMTWGDYVAEYNALRSFPAKRTDGRPFTAPERIMPELQDWFASINRYYPNEVNMKAMGKAFWDIHPLVACNTLVARLIVVWGMEYFEVE